MFDRDLVRDILVQIAGALEKVQNRAAEVKSAEYFTDLPQGMERLDGICMLLLAVGESVKSIDKMTGGDLLKKYPEIDWTGVKGFRDIIAHHYFDVDAEEVFWICKSEIGPLYRTVRRIIEDLNSA